MLFLLFVPLVICSAETFDWLNAYLKPNLTVTARPQSLDCTTSHGQLGKCVGRQYCTEALPENDLANFLRISNSTCPYGKRCCPSDKVLAVTNSLPGGCGYSKSSEYSFSSFSTSSEEVADYAEFPWMVALLNKYTTLYTTWSPRNFIGGGTLIHPSVVLTAAHKVYSIQEHEIICRAGEWGFRTDEEIYRHQYRNVRKFAIHGDFVDSQAQYDAALLFLDRPYDLSNGYHIGIACLAQDMPAPGTLCYGVGWGGLFQSNTLKKSQLPIMDHGTCQRKMRRTCKGPKFLLHNTLFCADDEDMNVCVGNGGCPLVCPVKSIKGLKRYVVTGMVAFGWGCVLRNVPGKYVKIPSVLEWINQQMALEELDTNSYNMITLR